MNIRIALSIALVTSASAPAADDFPLVGDDLEAALYARDPLVRNPCAITFDAKGRLCVGMGPQYRKPKPDTPGDSVWILVDEDGDGTADSRQQYATGFNSIQGLAWRGRDLYIANAPDLTIARDLDGDEVADEYVRLFTDLGNLEHGLHGLHFGPDGKLYMSKGNSKGLTQPPARVAPKPFRELWGVEAPGTPDFPEPVTFAKNEYEKHYHDPADDWGLTGGILRCEPNGTDLEIVARGFRNPWDICYDDEFNWLGTDNDQTHGDKIFAPFYGAHFGWGHPWSYDWKGDAHLPTAPSAGPLFEGSGTGVVFCGFDHYPDEYRGVFLINDWLRREVSLYRPTWNGAWMQPDRQKLEVVAHAGGGRAMSSSRGRSFDPVDIELGPDGAIYISSWGREYGLVEKDGEQANQGRIYRFWPKVAPPKVASDPKRERPISDWTLKELSADLASHIPVWRTNAQEELLRRNARAEIQQLVRETASTRAATWTLWTLGRLDPDDRSIDQSLLTLLKSPQDNISNYQIIRVLAHRARQRDENRLPDEFKTFLASDEARTRHETILAMRQVNERRWNDELLERIAIENDRIVSYSAWGALIELMPRADRKALLTDQRPAVRRAALLSLLEEDSLSNAEIRLMTNDSDDVTAALAAKRLGGKTKPEFRGAALTEGEYATPPAPDLRPVSVVSSIDHLPGRRYEEARLVVGTPAYTDRSYRVTKVPAELAGLTFIRPANNDADPASGPFLELALRYPSTVYLADDVRGKVLPAWARGKWEPTELFLETDDTRHRLFTAEHPAGRIRLGANRDGVQGRKGNYLVIVQPHLLAPPKAPTAVADVLPLLDKADAQRGRALFLSSHGAACASCHQLEGIGNVFAPDLSEIASRADPEFLVRSILDPNAAITEGFAMQIVTTKTGDTPAGIVIEETGRHLKVALVNGSVVTVEQRDIAKRETLPVSAMPPTFAGLLAPQDVADLVAYLLASKEPADTGSAQPEAATATEDVPGKPSPLSGMQWGDRENGFSIECHDERLAIRLNGGEIASYHFRHPETKRPFFAHLKTPSGLQVTRNFPPIEGVDATDHATMHPGLWLGFANLDGISFWHNNQGVVVHEKFVGEPTAEAASASFTVLNRYLAPDGRQVCEERASYRLLANDDGYLLTIDSRFRSDRPFTFGVKEEMGLGVRVATPLTVKDGKGTILSAGGGRNEKGTWGKVDRWWDYFGPLDAKSAGIQIMSGPGNPEVWSHSRDYGVLVANPFPIDNAQNRGKTIAVPPGEEFRLQFGVQVHEHAARDEFDPGAAHERYLQRIEP